MQNQAIYSNICLNSLFYDSVSAILTTRYLDQLVRRWQTYLYRVKYIVVLEVPRNLTGPFRPGCDWIVGKVQADVARVV